VYSSELGKCVVGQQDRAESPRSWKMPKNALTEEFVNGKDWEEN
jgi:hypothetical protein